MGGVLQGDLGRSLWTKEPILVEFARRFPVTLELTLLTIIISVTFGIGVGILSAIRQETWIDYIGRVVAIMALAMPVLLAGHPGGGDPRHLLALDTAVDLCAADHRCSWRTSRS